MAQTKLSNTLNLQYEAPRSTRNVANDFDQKVIEL